MSINKLIINNTFVFWFIYFRPIYWPRKLKGTNPVLAFSLFKNLYLLNSFNILPNYHLIHYMNHIHLIDLI